MRVVGVVLLLAVVVAGLFLLLNWYVAPTKPSETTDLDVAGLKAQVLERIETLEERERETEKLLAEIVPAMEAWGYDTGALKAVSSN